MREVWKELKGAAANEMIAVLEDLDQGRLDLSLIQAEFEAAEAEAAKRLGTLLRTLNDQVIIRRWMKELLDQRGSEPNDQVKAALVLLAAAWTNTARRPVFLMALSRSDQYPDHRSLPYQLAVLLDAALESGRDPRDRTWVALVTRLEQAFEQALCQHISDVVLWLLPDKTLSREVEDITQEVMEAVGTLPQPPVDKWKQVKTIARRRWIDRRRRPWARHEVLEDGHVPEGTVTSDAQQVLAARELVLIGLAPLSRSERKDFERFELDGMTMREIALATDRTEAMVTFSVRHARDKFRAAVSAAIAKDENSGESHRGEDDDDDQERT